MNKTEIVMRTVLKRKANQKDRAKKIEEFQRKMREKVVG